MDEIEKEYKEKNKVADASDVNGEQDHHICRQSSGKKLAGYPCSLCISAEPGRKNRIYPGFFLQERPCENLCRAEPDRKGQAGYHSRYIR
ncbi:hypothetical protein M5E86_17905 [Blautia wexlerae]|nr:hypothetical protein M5E86_17905 [Blautia wexlerae]